ncbi:MAG: DUF554 domain-containing protein [Oscillospiraceae bacterium]|nr:DUF554 domain-containing protein [Oscillospiraceae bacterium]
MITGALMNAAAVLIGGGAGLLFKGKCPKKITEGITRAIGLCVCIIGISGGLKGDFILLTVSLALGALAGELLDIDGALNKAALVLQKRISGGDEASSFAEGFTAASLLFCVGAMSVIGSIESGLNNDQSIILTKSVIDCVSAMVLASSLGVGVLFSAVVILIYQGGIELFAGYLQNLLTDGLITQLSAAGGVMILAIGLNMSLNAKIKAANLLPGLLAAMGYYFIFVH